MKRIVLIVPDDFDTGSVISLVGRDLLSAYVGTYVPRGTVAQPHPEPEEPVVTGRLRPEYKQLPGNSREQTSRPQKLNGRTIKENLLELLAGGNWVVVSELEARITELGYKEGSAHKMLSTMRIHELVEKTGTGTATRYRKRVTLQAISANGG